MAKMVPAHKTAMSSATLATSFYLLFYCSLSRVFELDVNDIYIRTRFAEMY